MNTISTRDDRDFSSDTREDRNVSALTEGDYEQESLLELSLSPQLLQRLEEERLKEARAPRWSPPTQSGLSNSTPIAYAGDQGLKLSESSGSKRWWQMHAMLQQQEADDPGDDQHTLPRLRHEEEADAVPMKVRSPRNQDSCSADENRGMYIRGRSIGKPSSPNAHARTNLTLGNTEDLAVVVGTRLSPSASRQSPAFDDDLSLASIVSGKSLESSPTGKSPSVERLPTTTLLHVGGAPDGEESVGTSTAAEPAARPNLVALQADSFLSPMKIGNLSLSCHSSAACSIEDDLKPRLKALKGQPVFSVTAPPTPEGSTLMWNAEETQQAHTSNHHGMTPTPPHSHKPSWLHTHFRPHTGGTCKDLPKLKDISICQHVRHESGAPKRIISYIASGFKT